METRGDGLSGENFKNIGSGAVRHIPAERRKKRLKKPSTSRSCTAKYPNANCVSAQSGTVLKADTNQQLRNTISTSAAIRKFSGSIGKNVKCCLRNNFLLRKSDDDTQASHHILWTHKTETNGSTTGYRVYSPPHIVFLLHITTNKPHCFWPGLSGNGIYLYYVLTQHLGAYLLNSTSKIAITVVDCCCDLRVMKLFFCVLCVLIFSYD